MKIHSKQLFNYLEKKGLKLDDKMKSEIIELIYFGKNDKGKYISKEEAMVAKTIVESIQYYTT